MVNILLYVAMGLVFGGYILYFLLIFIYRNNEIGDCSGFEVTKDIISEYNSINVIENSGYFTIYNIKRRVIKIASSCYYGKNLVSISISLMEAGISIVDNNENKYINLLRNIFSNLKILYVFPLFGIFISNSSFNVSDANASIFFLLLFVFISYILLDIRRMACDFVNDNISRIVEIKKVNRMKITNFMNKLLLCDKLIYFGELVMIIRLVLIMFGI